ncbi:hypothetical protein [Vibrio sp. R78045]|uniref:hypothetical protein n=1 Tax=Vibrio sp. R78045 TaxID=3093868 RepID=UPI0036F25E7D
MKHTLTYAIYGLTFLILISIGAINHLVEQEPVRKAVIGHTDSVSKKHSIKPIKVWKTSRLTDAKLKTWVEKVVATCFSFTLTNINSKPEYCANKYFNYSSSSAYLNSYVSRVGAVMEKSTANFYTGMPYPPIIVLPVSARANRFYYTVYVQTVSSLVERKYTSPSVKGIWFFVAPSPKANDESQFTIIGIEA